MASRILVTGYGGFLGSAICRNLLNQGYSVRGIARKSYPALANSGVEVISGDLRDLAAVTQACQGVDAIIHTAAIAAVWGPRAEFESINVEATRNLLQCAAENRVASFVYSSSPSVTFDGSDQCGIDETAPYPKAWLCDYPRTKAIAEQLVLKANDRHKMQTCSLRPHLIWGHGDPHLIPRLIDRAQSGRLVRIGNGFNLIDTVHVEAAAQAHVLALNRMMAGDDEAAGRSYFITDGEPIACWEWISRILETAGLRVTKKAVPFTVAYAMGALFEFVYRRLGRQDEPPMTRFVAAQLGKQHYFDIGAAKRLLDYSPISDRMERLGAMKPWLTGVQK